MADPIKDYYLNQYTGATSGLNQPVTMTDSPIFQKGFEKWDPTSASSLYANAMLHGTNLVNKLKGSDKVTYGLAGLGSGATFKQMPKNPTGIEQLGFADVFGHEMSHLGWDYKPKNELINVPGVGKEGGPKVTSDYTGEEQWNYMHDLMYGPKSYSIDSYKKDLTNLKNQFASGKINQDQYKAEGLALGEKLQGLSGHLTPGEGYLTKKGLINKGDLSYTPKAHDEIAWSGLTSADKKAIGFGVNPFEDTKAAGQWYAQQKYKKMSKAKKQAQMQQTIRQHEAAEAAKQKAAADAAAAAKAKAEAAAAQQVQQNIQTYGNQDRPNTGMNAPGGGKGQSPTGGDVSGTPFNSGGLVNFYRYGGFI